MNNKSKKGAKIAVNVIVTIIAILVLIIAVNTLVSNKKGYTSFFGTASYAVKTESMEGDKKDSFDKGDLIFVKVLKNDTQRAALKPDSVITFWDIIDGKRQLNTHRIIGIFGNANVGIQYQTQGDNSPITEMIDYREVVGVYQSKIANVGSLITFFKSATGFLIFVVVPSILILIYCIFNFVRNYKKFAIEKATVAIEQKEKENDREAAKEQMRLEILKEIEKEKSNNEKE